jgi:hypothetical protein
MSDGLGALRSRGIRDGGLVQVSECLTSKHEALSSNPSRAKIIIIIINLIVVMVAQLY